MIIEWIKVFCFLIKLIFSKRFRREVYKEPLENRKAWNEPSIATLG